MTKDEGRCALKKVLTTVEGFASIAKSKAEFERMIQKKYGQQALAFPDFDSYVDETKKDTKFGLSDFKKKIRTSFKLKS